MIHHRGHGGHRGFSDPNDHTRLKGYPSRSLWVMIRHIRKPQALLCVLRDLCGEKALIILRWENRGNRVSFSGLTIEHRSASNPLRQTSAALSSDGRSLTYRSNYHLISSLILSLIHGVIRTL